MILALLLAQAAAVPVPAAPCTTDAALPPALAFWKQPASGADLVLFRPVVLPLHPGPVRHGGPRGAADATFTIDKAGDYTIAASAGGWIGITPATGGKEIDSIAHAQGPKCTTIAKYVSFPLRAGRYRLALSEVEGTSVKVALTPGKVETVPHAD